MLDPTVAHLARMGALMADRTADLQVEMETEAAMGAVMAAAAKNAVAIFPVNTIMTVRW